MNSNTNKELPTEEDEISCLDCAYYDLANQFCHYHLDRKEFGSMNRCKDSKPKIDYQDEICDRISKKWKLQAALVYAVRSNLLDSQKRARYSEDDIISDDEIWTNKGTNHFLFDVSFPSRALLVSTNTMKYLVRDAEKAVNEYAIQDKREYSVNVILSLHNRKMRARFSIDVKEL